MTRDWILAATMLGLAACGSQPAGSPNDRMTSSMPAPNPEPRRDPRPAQTTAAQSDPPPAPGQPGGLPDDRTPVAEGPITPDSAQGAAQIVERYAGLLEAGNFAGAYALWGDDGRASDMDASAFAESWSKYAEIHGQIGAPGRIEGAAGSLYVEVPLQLYGTVKGSGERFNMVGPITLRRVNGVPGATPEQLRWHISTSGLKPRP